MKRPSTIAVFLALSFLAGQRTFARSGHDLFQKGLVKERVNGDLNEAIRLYQQIVEDFADDRALAAKTLVQMGQCYEKLGRAEARRAYERVVREFADQPEPVRTARQHLEQLDGGDPGQVEAELVWTNPSVRQIMAPSPDGRYLAFQDPDTGDLAIRDFKVGENRRLTHNAVPWEAYTSSPMRFSPDGKWIAYIWYHDEDEDGEQEQEGELRIIGIDGSGSRIVCQPEGAVRAIMPCAWFRDGEQILGRLHRDNGDPQAVVVSVADGSVRVIDGPDRQYFSLSLSPDERYIAYGIWDAGSSDIVMLAVDGGEEILVVEHPADDTPLGWTPDGGMLVFHSNRRGQGYDVWGIQIIDGKPQGRPQCLRENLDQAGVVSGDGHFTRDGSFYYPVKKPSMDNVYIAALDPETGEVTGLRRASERPEGETNFVEWSPDGKHLLYTAKITRPFVPREPQVIVMRNVQTGQEREIPLPPGARGMLGYGKPWSPDGRSILISRRVSGPPRGRELCRLGVPSGKVTPIVSAGGLPVGWSADGKKVFFFRGGRILVHSLETGQEKELYRREESDRTFLERVVLSPDRQQLVFVSGISPGGKRLAAKALMVLPTEGGKARELFRVQQGYITPWGPIAWTPDGRYILFMTCSQRPWLSLRPSGRIQFRDVPHELWRIPVEGGEPQKLELPDGVGIGAWDTLRVHPNGKQIAFSASDTPDDELWLMKSFLPDLASPQTLTGTDDPERPFGLDVEVPDPEGDDVKEFAASIKLSGDDDDWNAPQWCGKVHQGKRGSLDGLWENRYDRRYTDNRNIGRSIAQVKTVGDWVYILTYDWGYELIKARRQGNRLLGRYIGLKDPIEDWGPWVGLIVNDERIDGAYTKGRWDLRRDFLPSVELTRPASDDFAAPGGTELSLPVDVAVGVRGLKRFVARSEDDAEEYNAGDILLEDDDLDLGRMEGEDGKVVGIRFADIHIPKGTRIKKAYLQFTAENDYESEPTELTIQAELSGNAEPFTKADHNISARRRARASVKWSPEPWDVVGEQSEKQRTPDLSSLIQEVVAQPDWRQSNAIVFLISGSGDRDAESYDGDQQNAPMLHIEY